MTEPHDRMASLGLEDFAVDDDAGQPLSALAGGILDPASG